MNTANFGTTRGLLWAVWFALSGFPATLCFAQATAHYPPGIEGIKGASLPPPGLYFRDYNLLYFADRLNDADGDRIKGADFKTVAYAQVPRLVWITDTRLLGGHLGVDALVPLVYQDVGLNTPGGRFDSNDFSVGDPFVEATLSWHRPRYSVSLGAGEWLGIGNYDPPPSTLAGLGYWGTMFTAGATWYPDVEKTWALSLLNRYEINCEQRDTDITPGQAYTLEWALSKALHQTLDVGVVGYYQQQTTRDEGDGATRDRDRVAAVGTEISFALPAQRLFVSARYCYEFWSEARAQGHTLALTLTYRF